MRPALAEQRASGSIDALPSEELRAGAAAFEQVRTELDELSTRMQARTDDRFDDIAAAQRSANIAVGSAVVLALATGVAAVLLVRRRLVRPLDRLLAEVAEAARPPHPGPVTGAREPPSCGPSPQASSRSGSACTRARGSSARRAASSPCGRNVNGWRRTCTTS